MIVVRLIVAILLLTALPSAPGPAAEMESAQATAFPIPQPILDGKPVPPTGFRFDGFVTFPDGGIGVRAFVFEGASMEWGDDRYGPWILQIDRQGRPVRQFHIPKTAMFAQPVLGFGNSSVLLAYEYDGTLCLSRISRRSAVLWQECVSSLFTDEAKPFVRAPDGGFIMAHPLPVTDPDRSSACRVLRLGGSGRLLWAQAFYDRENCIPRAISVLGDGGSIVVADARPFKPGAGTIMRLVRLDPKGRKLWERQIDAYDATAAGLADAGVAILAPKESGPGERSWALVRLNADGDEVWRLSSEAFAVSSSSPARLACSLPGEACIFGLPEGEILVILWGSAARGRRHAIDAARVSKDGRVRWVRTAAGSDGALLARSVQSVAVLSDRRIVFAIAEKLGKDETKTSLLVLPFD